MEGNGYNEAISYSFRVDVFKKESLGCLQCHCVTSIISLFLKLYKESQNLPVWSRRVWFECVYLLKKPDDEKFSSHFEVILLTIEKDFYTNTRVDTHVHTNSLTPLTQNAGLCLCESKWLCTSGKALKMGDTISLVDFTIICLHLQCLSYQEKQLIRVS